MLTFIKILVSPGRVWSRVEKLVCHDRNLSINLSYQNVFRQKIQIPSSISLLKVNIRNLWKKMQKSTLFLFIIQPLLIQISQSTFNQLLKKNSSLERSNSMFHFLPGSKSSGFISNLDVLHQSNINAQLVSK